MKLIAKIFAGGIAGVFLIVAFQNCAGQEMHFSEASSLSAEVPEVLTPSPLPVPITDRYGDIECALFGAFNGQKETCLDSQTGLLGRLYYLEDDRDDRSSIASTLRDKNGESIPFNGNNLHSVNVLIERGFSSDVYILTKAINTPAISFKSGFQISDSNYLKDHNGRVLIEAFALDLKGSIRLLRGQGAGYYEFAVISDDGSILEIDSDGDGIYDYIINNDGYHSPRMKCGQGAVFMNAESELPIRFRFYQGPRETIAAMLVMRRVASPDLAGQDADCGFTDGQVHAGRGSKQQWFGAPSTQAGYTPNYSTSIFGDLLARGWFVPSDQMFSLPPTLD